MIWLRSTFVIVLTFLIAFALTILPMPGWTVWLRPAWTLLILCYWTLAIPHRVNIASAFIAGIFMDALMGTPLGEHSIALILVAYIILKFNNRLRMFPFMQQALCIFLLTLVYQVVIFIVEGAMGHFPTSLLYWLASVTTMLLWPWVFIILRDCRRNFKVS